MSRPPVEYLNARKAAKPASGGKVYSRRVRYAEDEERLIRRGRRCADCGLHYADPPSRLCPGCEAYREHQA
jgi:hypothetical protein